VFNQWFFFNKSKESKIFREKFGVWKVLSSAFGFNWEFVTIRKSLRRAVFVLRKFPFFFTLLFWVLEYIHGFVAMSIPELKAFYCQDTLTKVIYCDFIRMLTI
jgi:hypothetical protein